MITPNKFITFQESVLSKLPYILEQDLNGVEIAKLYELTEKKFGGIDEFLYALDVLYVLDKITVDIYSGKIHHAH